MRISPRTPLPNRTRSGYIAVMSVLGLSTILLLTLLSSFRFAIQSQEVQRQSQIRIDYAHREQALLRAVLTTAPNRAAQNMMKDSKADTSFMNSGRWRWVFEDAMAVANSETILDETTKTGLGVAAGSVSGNTGDGEQGHVRWVVTPIGEQRTGDFIITPGINGQDTVLGAGYPDALILAGDAASDDRDRPYITWDKTYSDGSLYKAIPYPNVHFGYGEQNQTFVAKRNWWAFTVGFGHNSASETGIQRVQKHYVLSIYEVPSQLALGSTSATLFGVHEDGSQWDNAKVSVDGGVFATEAETEGFVTLQRLAARRGVKIGSSSVVGGVSENIYTGSLSSREEYEATNAGFFPISSSSDSGLVAFIPINRGAAGFDDLSDVDDPNRWSPTGWNHYSRPALQCAMTLRIEDVVSPWDQTPTQISFRYKVGGIDNTAYYTKGVNWPSASSTEGESFPFHLDRTDDDRNGIAVYIERMPAFLNTIGADSTAINNSIVLSANYRDNANIIKPNIPYTSADNIFILRDAADLTAYTNGFSLVSPFRMYVANDVNIVPSGVDLAGAPVYPPLSLFSPSHRFGIKDNPVEVLSEGQLNYLGKNGSSPVRPLDMKSGKNDEIVPENIRANLFSIKDPSQLPPVNQMNWLVTIEEVRQP